MIEAGDTPEKPEKKHENRLREKVKLKQNIQHG